MRIINFMAPPRIAYAAGLMLCICRIFVRDAFVVLRVNCLQFYAFFVVGARNSCAGLTPAIK